MTLPPSLPAALRAHAARTPEAPWLFHRDAEHDWRWLSFAAVVARLDETADAAAGDAPAGDGMGPTPENVLSALATGALEPWLAEASEVALALGPAPRRDVTVLGRPVGDGLGALHLTWAALSGAALVLEADPDSFIPTALWTRPTVLAVDAAELALWSAQPQLRGGRRPRLAPLGRLRAWVVARTGEIAPADAARWNAEGVPRVLVAPRHKSVDPMV